MRNGKRIIEIARVASFLACACVGHSASALQVDISGPPGSVAFGNSVAVLPNGNFVVSDPSGPVLNIGAIYLYSPDANLISYFTGGSPDDHVGDGGIVVLPSGNFLVLSPHVRNGSATNAGAVTWVDGTTGLSGAVGADNSLVGSSTDDMIGAPNVGDAGFVGGGVTVLANGNYVVSSVTWDNAAIADAGAATFGSGTTGVAGEISNANSLIGTHAGDHVGNFVFALSNGNYVVDDPDWDNGAVVDAGAVTWASGVSGRVGAVSASNSLVGLTASDHVGGVVTGLGYTESAIAVLGNGNYVVLSPEWNNGAVVDAGAATWGNGAAGVSGIVSQLNSLVGSQTGDYVGYYGVAELTNGNYVVRSALWDNGAAQDAGAATWGSGSAGVAGVISAGNSLVGSSTNDYVGSLVVALSNGNYAVASSNWSNGATSHVGAVTWGNGASGTSGAVSTANSLVGVEAGDTAGSGGVDALTNGSYLVRTPQWNNASATHAGAVTWRDGTAPAPAAVSSSNSLVGSTSEDRVGDVNARIVALANGSYVVGSRLWHNGGAANAGAVTWGSGAGGISGEISASNSLVGSSANDLIGTQIWPLANGNYVASSPYWDNGGAADAGAATWCDGSAATTNPVSAANSLVGATALDQVGGTVVALANGNYVVVTPGWDDGGKVNVGAATWGSGAAGVKGPVSAANSLIGSTQGDSVFAVSALANGNFVVFAPSWDNGAVVDAGAATWVDGSHGAAGSISPASSLVGTTAGDLLGNGSGLVEFSDGNYVFNTRYWDNGGIVDAGALTFASGSGQLVGTIQPWNSVEFTVNGAGAFPRYDYDATRHRLLVGRATENRVTLFTLEQIFKSGFEL